MLEQASVSGFDRFLVRLGFAVGFLSALDLLTPGGSGTRILAVVVLLLLMVSNREGISTRILAAQYGLAGLSLLSILASWGQHADPVGRMWQSLAAVAFGGVLLSLYHAAYVRLGRNVSTFFVEYLHVAFLFALVGCLQELLFVASGVNPLDFLGNTTKNYGSMLGVSALSVEPAWYACALLPAGAFYVAKFVDTLRMGAAGVVTVAAIIFSTSAVGLLGLVLAGAFAALSGERATRARVIAVSAPLFAWGAWTLIQQDFIQLRLNDSLALAQGGLRETSVNANLSSYSLAVNASIAAESVADGYGFGAGFGNYSSVYETYIGSYYVPSYRSSLPGEGSATSLFLRAMGELGLAGVAILGWVLNCYVRAFRSRSRRPIVIACLATYLSILLRMGEMFDNGVMFIILMGPLLSSGLAQWSDTSCRARDYCQISRRPHGRL